jgi:hypothetical protein
VQNGRVHSDGDNENISEFHGSRKKDVEQGRRQAKGKEIKQNQIHLITGLAASAAGLVVLSP